MIKQQKLILLIFLMLAISIGCQSESAVPDPTPIAAATNTTSPTIAATHTPNPTNTAVPPTLTPQPTATPAAVPVDRSLIQNNAIILYYHDKDLWRTDIDGNQQPLTEGDLLAAWDLESAEDKWWSGGSMPRPFISPDGRYIALTRTGSNLIIIDLADPTTPRTLSSGSTLMAWSPDSRYLAYGRGSLQLYDTTTQQSRPLTQSLSRGVHNITWSPDGRFIGFSCCFAEPETDYQGIEYGDIKQYDLETGLIETVGQSFASVAGGTPALCWQGTGNFISQVDATPADNCTSNGSFLFYTAQAPDLQRNAKMLFSDTPDNDPLHLHLLTLEIIGSGEILWEMLLEEPANRLAWTPDGRYILLNNDYPSLSPIRRLNADGLTAPEPLTGDAYLIGVIPQWQLPE